MMLAHAQDYPLGQTIQLGSREMPGKHNGKLVTAKPGEESIGRGKKV